MFKSAEERAAEKRARTEREARERQAREEAQRRAEEERRQEAFARTPVGAATLARQRGERFFEVQLEVGEQTGSALMGSVDGKRRTYSSARILGDIEAVGWRLEHVGYVYVVTGQQSSDRFIGTGQATAVQGVTVGVYLFRSAEAPAGAEAAGG